MIGLATEAPPQPAGKAAALPLVLVVDDCPIDRRLAAATIEKHAAVQTRTAANGLEALAAIKQQVPAVVVTDLQMPEMDGLQLTELVREQYPQVPVILMTANGSEEIAFEALRKGAAFYVPKQNLARDLPDAAGRVLQSAGLERRQRVLDMVKELDCVLELENDPAMVPQVVAHFQEHALRLGLCDGNSKVRLGISLEEALLNAIYHGNLGLSSELRQDGSDTYQRLAAQRRDEEPYAPRRVRVRATLNEREARFVIRDEGNGFDVSNLPDPTDPENLLRLSGRGVLLIRMFMDEVRYNSRGNELTMALKKKA